MVVLNDPLVVAILIMLGLGATPFAIFLVYSFIKDVIWPTLW